MCSTNNDEEIYFNIFCIDKRFDYLTTSYYFREIGFIDKYYMGTTAGSSLCFGYETFCKDLCNKDCYHCIDRCDPSQKEDMNLLKDALIKNIDIALSLDKIQKIYLLNHQDCGAIKAYLSCSGYPQELGENNQLEIRIQTEILVFAAKYLQEKYPLIKIRLGLIDVNGTVCDLDVKYATWQLVYRGPGNNPKGLWWKFDTFGVNVNV